ncbi:MAG: hypothetical protein JSS56_29015, partial [Proteobacteria bacterium]|nr:hypothetical protein [Pseudomonadota bacterium]
LLPAAVHGTRFIIERYLQDGNIELDPMIRMDSVSLMRTMISQGLGCAILPTMACSSQLASGEFVAKALKPALSRTLYLARLRERNQTLEARAMEDEIISVVEADSNDQWTSKDD